MADRAESFLTQQLGQELVDPLVAELQNLDRVATTQDAVDLAGRIVEVLQQAAEDSQEGPQEESEADAGDDSEADADAEAGDDPDAEENSGAEAEAEADEDSAGGSDADAEADEDSAGDSDADANAEADEDSKANGDAEADGNSDAEAEADGDGNSDDERSRSNSQANGEGGANGGNAGASAAAASILGEQAPELDIGALLGQQLEQEPQAPEMEFPELVDGLDELFGVDAALQTQGRLMTQRLRSQLTALLEAKARSGWRRERSGRRMDHRRLHRTSVGDPRIFRRRGEARGRDTAVLLLADVSGSMDTQVSNQAPTHANEIAVVSAASAVEAIGASPGVDVAMMSFGTPLVRHRNFGDSTWRCSPYRSMTLGGTLLHAALTEALLEFRKVRNHRKILLVFSDGDPFDPPETNAMLARMGSAGIERYGIGVGRRVCIDALDFDRTSRIDSATQLPTELFSMLRGALERAA